MRYCLIIDDNDQSDTIDNMMIKAKERGFPVEFFYFNPTIEECLSQDGGEFVIDLSKVENALNKRFATQSLHIVATDYQLDDDKITGMEIVRFIKEKWRPNVPVVLYSGLKELIMTKLRSELCIDDLNKAFKNLENFFKFKPDQIFERGQYEERVYEILKKKNLSLDLVLEEKLLEQKDNLFRNIFPQYEGKTLGEIAKVVRSDSSEAEVFKREFLERSIAHYIDLKD